MGSLAQWEDSLQESAELFRKPYEEEEGDDTPL